MVETAALPSIYKVIRETIADTMDPENIATSDVLLLAQDRWRALGGQSHDIQARNVSSERHKLRQKFGVLTREKLKQYSPAPKLVSVAPPTIQKPLQQKEKPVFKTMSEMPSVMSVVREMILQESDVRNFDRRRVLSIVRARWTHLGGNPADVKDHCIQTTLSKVIEILGKNFTKQDLARYHQTCVIGGVNNRVKKVTLPLVKAPTQESAVAPTKESSGAATQNHTQVEVKHLLAVKELVTMCGGLDNARKQLPSMLDLLEKFQK